MIGEAFSDRIGEELSFQADGEGAGLLRPVIELRGIFRVERCE